jgi:hypothetical protein
LVAQFGLRKPTGANSGVAASQMPPGEDQITVMVGPHGEIIRAAFSGVAAFPMHLPEEQTAVAMSPEGEISC